MSFRIKIYISVIFCILFHLILILFYFKSINDLDDTYIENEVIFENDYKLSELKRWIPAPPIPEEIGQVGEMGKPVDIPPQHHAVMVEKFKIHQFNLLASDVISLNRSLPDFRSDKCRSKKYPSLLPTTSVVIIFHNEAWSTLLRTVWSVINRSPRSLLREIILVDDASEHRHLGKKLEEYIAKITFPIKLFRTGTRSGLIKARLLGAKYAKGQTITFLDSHCECTHGWLEPLLSRIVRNRKTIASPVIGIIDQDSFSYPPLVFLKWGGFNWKLEFGWNIIPQREMHRINGDLTVPLRTPAICGGLFSVDKKYFYEMGSFDEEMDIWGKENIEISLRIWQCGGTLEIVPCSHVGHVFRKTSPYTFPGSARNVINHNTNRVAKVWLDEWINFFYFINPYVKKTPTGNITSRLELRKKLNCKSFRWYLENVYPESPFPLNYHYMGHIQNEETNECLQYVKENLEIANCRRLSGKQIFIYTHQNEILSNGDCLDAYSKTAPIQMVRCHSMGGNQAWKYNKYYKTIIHIRTGNCLTKPDTDSPSLPVLRRCTNIGQKWLMVKDLKWQND